jgi:hypothetical protein
VNEWEKRLTPEAETVLAGVVLLAWPAERRRLTSGTTMTTSD